MCPAPTAMEFLPEKELQPAMESLLEGTLLKEMPRGFRKALGLWRQQEPGMYSPMAPGSRAMLCARVVQTRWERVPLAAATLGRWATAPDLPTAAHWEPKAPREATSRAESELLPMGLDLSFLAGSRTVEPVEWVDPFATLGSVLPLLGRPSR